MKYMGSKNRYAKYILPIILKDRKPNQWYVEPFVGGFNMIDKVTGLRLANDSHYYLIQLFRAIQNGWVPPDNVYEQEYISIRDNLKRLENCNYPAHLIGFIGFGCSFSGKWFGGYARSFDRQGLPRNHCLESKTNILKQAPKLKGIVIENKNYLDLVIPDNSIIYCDPPYQNTTKYSFQQPYELATKFNHEIFWDWVRELARNGHKVFVSEYSAPNDFECVWSKEVVSNLDVTATGKKNIERLFTL